MEQIWREMKRNGQTGTCRDRQGHIGTNKDTHIREGQTGTKRKTRDHQVARGAGISEFSAPGLYIYMLGEAASNGIIYSI